MTGRLYLDQSGDPIFIKLAAVVAAAPYPEDPAKCTTVWLSAVTCAFVLKIKFSEFMQHLKEQ